MNDQELNQMLMGDQPQQEVQPIETKPVETEVKEPKIESSKEYNLRVLRERAESEQAARLKAEQRIAELEKKYAQPVTQQQQTYNEPDDVNIDDDSYIEGKLYKQLRQEQKQLRQELNQYRQYTQEQTSEMRLKAELADFDQVVSKENIQNLKQIYPEEFQTLSYNPDVYSKGKAAYNIIKRYGLAENYEEVDKKIEANKAKPRSSANSVGQISDTPLARIGDFDRRILTEERKEQLRRQVAEARKYK